MKFEYLCDLVRADLQKQQTRMRASISVEERVGLALYGDLQPAIVIEAVDYNLDKESRYCW